MARARVQLREGTTYTLGRKTWKKGVPQILTNEAEIEQYKANGRFAVSMLKEPPKQKSAPMSAAGSSQEGEEAPKSSGSRKGRSSRAERSE